MPDRHPLQIQYAVDGQSTRPADTRGSAILSDRIGHLPRRQANNRLNPFQDPVREVRVQLDTGKVLRIFMQRS